MATRLIIEGNSVYEIDEECEKEKRKTGMRDGRYYRAGKQERGVVERFSTGDKEINEKERSEKKEQ
ncbi:MAG: hypothetical protein IJ374_06220 [Lachnospiraceae bacterium]|nr:hypothetical protein [Lachnospiraceae bacterium]